MALEKADRSEDISCQMGVIMGGRPFIAPGERDTDGLEIPVSNGVRRAIRIIDLDKPFELDIGSDSFVIPPDTGTDRRLPLGIQIPRPESGQPPPFWDDSLSTSQAVRSILADLM